MDNTKKIHFEKASINYKKTIYDWLEASHVKEFWDNSQNHKDDILIFMNGRKDPSHYFEGICHYWIGFINNEPYCLFVTTEVLPTEQEIPEAWKSYLSKSGKTFTIDFMIGNETYFGKGLASPTLKAFTGFIKTKIDSSVDTFLIDPEESNQRAIHVYTKAGFHHVADFHRDWQNAKNVKHYLMVKKMIKNITYEELEQVELRSGTIIRAEPFPKAKRPAYKIWADFGDEIGELQTSAQVTQNYTPESLIGRSIIGCVNLGEKNIAGFLSQFLLVGFSDETGAICLASFDAKVPDGQKLH